MLRTHIGLTHIAQVYLDRVTDTEEFYLTMVATSPPAPLTWHLSAAAIFPRGACTSPMAVVGRA